MEKGALTEQYVLQQLVSDTEYTPYYFGTEKATFEQDFLIRKGKNIIPIEVKAETNIRSQSLKAYCDKYHPEKAVRFSTRQYADQGWMENIPLYAVCNLWEKQIEVTKVKKDLGKRWLIHVFPYDFWYNIGIINRKDVYIWIN